MGEFGVLEKDGPEEEGTTPSDCEPSGEGNGGDEVYRRRTLGRGARCSRVLDYNETT